MTLSGFPVLVSSCEHDFLAIVGCHIVFGMYLFAEMKLVQKWKMLPHQVSAKDIQAGRAEYERRENVIHDVMFILSMHVAYWSFPSKPIKYLK